MSARCAAPTAAIKLPSVIALKYYVRPSAFPAFTRFNLFLRDKFACQYCGSGNDLTFDHVVPRAQGGRTTWENVVTACAPCNLKKGGRTPKQAGMPLHIERDPPDQLAVAGTWPALPAQLSARDLARLALLGRRAGSLRSNIRSMRWAGTPRFGKGYRDARRHAALLGFIVAAGPDRPARSAIVEESAPGFVPPTNQTRADYLDLLDKSFTRMDGNGDGVIEADEIPARRAARIKVRDRRSRWRDHARGVRPGRACPFRPDRCQSRPASLTSAERRADQGGGSDTIGNVTP